MKDDLDDAGVLELERKMHRVWAEALAFVWEAKDTKGGNKGVDKRKNKLVQPLIGKKAAGSKARNEKQERSGIDCVCSNARGGSLVHASIQYT